MMLCSRKENTKHMYYWAVDGLGKGEKEFLGKKGGACEQGGSLWENIKMCQ